MIFKCTKSFIFYDCFHFRLILMREQIAEYIAQLLAYYNAGVESEQTPDGAKPYRRCVWHILYHWRFGYGK
jgi:hypothetical protein